MTGQFSSEGAAQLSGTNVVNYHDDAGALLVDIKGTSNLANNTTFSAVGGETKVIGTSTGSRVTGGTNIGITGSGSLTAGNINFGSGATLSSTGSSVAINNQDTGQATTITGTATIQSYGTLNVNSGAGSHSVNITGTVNMTSSASSVSINSGAGSHTANFTGNNNLVNGTSVSINTGTGTNYARFGNDATITSRTGDVLINTSNTTGAANGGTDTVVFGNDATITSAGDITINTNGGGDSATFGNDAKLTAEKDITGYDGGVFGDRAKLTARNGRILLQGESYGHDANITAKDEVELIRVKAGDSALVESQSSYVSITDSRFGDDQYGSNTGPNILADHEILIHSSIFGDDAIVKAGNQLVIDSTGTFGRSRFGDGADLTANLWMYITDTDIGSGSELTAGENIILTNSTFASTATIESLGKSVGVFGTSVGAGSRILAKEDVVIGDMADGTGSTLGTGATVRAGAKFYGQGENTVLKAGYTINAASGIILSDGITVEGGPGSTMTTASGDIGITGARIEGDVTIANTGAGNVYITNWSLLDAAGYLDDPALYTIVGPDTHITVAGAGNIYLEGAARSAAPGDVQNLVIGPDSSIKVTGSGDIVGKWIETQSGVELSTGGGLIHITESIIGGSNVITTDGDGYIYLSSIAVGDGTVITTGGAGNIVIDTGTLGSGIGIANNGAGSIYLLDITTDPTYSFNSNTFTSNGDGNIVLDTVTMGNGNDFLVTGDGNIALNDVIMQGGGNLFTTQGLATGDISITGTAIRTQLTNGNEFETGGAGNIFIQNVDMENSNRFENGGDGWIRVDDVTMDGSNVFTSHGAGDIVVTGTDMRTRLGNGNEFETGGAGNIFIQNVDMANGNRFENGGDGWIRVDDVTMDGGNVFTSHGAGDIVVTGTDMRTRLGNGNEFETGGAGNIFIQNVDMENGNRFENGGDGWIRVDDVTMDGGNFFTSHGAGAIAVTGTDMRTSLGTGNEFRTGGAGDIYLENVGMDHDNTFANDGDGHIFMNEVAMKNGNAVTSSGAGNVVILDSTLDNGNEITAAGDGFIHIQGTDPGDMRIGTGNTISVGGYGSIYLGKTLVDSGNAFSNGTGGNIGILESVFIDQNSFTVGTATDNGGGNIDIFKSDFGRNNTFEVFGDGSIRIGQTDFGIGNIMTVYGAGSIIFDQVTTQEGNIFRNTLGGETIQITNSAIGAENKIYTHGRGGIYLNTVTIGEKSEIYNEKGGFVYIENVQAGSNTIITSSGFDEGSANEWFLTGDTNNIKGTLVADGFHDTVVVTGTGFYHTLDNTRGTADITIHGGYFDTIRNSSGNAGDSKLTLAYHHNGITDRFTANDQAVKHIAGSTDADVEDELVVASGARYTEYHDLEHNNVDRDEDTVNSHITSIVNYDRLVVEGRGFHQTVDQTDAVLTRTGLEVGTRDSAGADVKFEVGTVTLGAFADLFIHRNATSGYQHKSDSITTEFGSVLWLDRTTVAGFSKDIVSIEIGGGGMITGYSAGSNNPSNTNAAPNIIGDLTITGKAVLKPYSLEHYNQQFLKDTSLLYDDGLSLNSGVGLIIAGTTNASGDRVGGNLHMEGAAVLASRIFGEDAGMIHVQNGGGSYTQGSHADYVKAENVTFYGKATFTPTFGNDNELGAKHRFKLYEGDGSSTENTYYYSIVRSGDEIQYVDHNGNVIAAGKNIDANDLFDNQIIKSDMMGEWYFEMSEDGKEVLLRYRLLAKHPTQGGIQADMVEPNARNAAAQIDRIRYPFEHDKLDVRYNGDMKETYRDLARDNPDLYPNYKHYYIEDFEQLLLNIQNVITTGADLNQAIRKLHPEPYADLANINLSVMDQFHRTREQHGISSLFMVEQEMKDRAYARASGESETAYASLNDDCDYSYGSFVENPIRWWAAGFGSEGKQKMISTEYGYDTEVWGGAVGMMKEFRDFYFGLSAGYARVDTDWKELAASAKTDAFMVDAVMGLRRGMGFFEAFGTYAYNDHSVTRDVSFAGYSGIARGEYHDDVWSAGARMGYQYLFADNWLFIPTIGVNYISSKSGSFTESGRYNMSVLLDFAKGDIHRKNVRVPITGRLQRSFAMCGYVLTPEVRGSVSGIFGNKRAKASTRFVGDPSADGRFMAQGVETGRWAAQVGGSLEFSRMGRFTLTGNYDYTFAKKSHEHNYSLMMGMNF